MEFEKLLEIDLEKDSVLSDHEEYVEDIFKENTVPEKRRKSCIPSLSEHLKSPKILTEIAQNNTVAELEHTIRLLHEVIIAKNTAREMTRRLMNNAIQKHSK